MGISEDANAAADYIETHGWCQHELHNSQNNVCILGGIIGAAGIGSGVPQVVQNYLELTVPLYVWNNEDGRTQEEVVQVLRDVATKYMPDEMRSSTDG